MTANAPLRHSTSLTVKAATSPRRKPSLVKTFNTA
jgi:hypothetical protein